MEVLCRELVQPDGTILRRPSGASRRSLCAMSLLRQPILLLAKSEQVKKLVSTMPVSSGHRHQLRPR